MDAHTSEDRVFARAAVVVRRVDDDTLELANLAEGWSCRATGRLGAAVQAVIAGAAMGPVLTALGQDHPLVRAVALIEGDAGRPLSMRHATELDGYDTLFIELTGACNERCIHCYAESSPGITEQLEAKICREVLEDAAVLGFQRVQLTGGDPLLCPFLVDLVQTTKQQGIAVCEIFTNGLALSPRLVESLRPLQPALALSFYSVDAECHDAITRTPGSQQGTLRALRRALEAGFSVRIAVIAMEQNAHTIDETVAFLRELGAEHVNVTAMRPVGRGGLYDGPLNAVITHDSSPEPQAHPASPRSGKLCVTYRGQVVPCIFNRQDILGDLRLRRLRDIAVDPRGPAVVDVSTDELIESCRDRLQCAACRVTAFSLRAAAPSVKR